MIPEIQNHSVEVNQVPFNHIYAENFFTDAFHELLCQEFEKVMSQGLADQFSLASFSRFPGYDAYYWLLPPETGYPLNLFYSQEWKDHFSRLFGIPLTNDIVAEFHHHQVDSQDGFVHNDYNLCCFTENRLPNGMNPWYYTCNYDPAQNDMTTGLVTSHMRSIALIYYFNNDPWLPGDGGETALFNSEQDLAAARLTPPISNSLLAFEVSPDSYHGFRQNFRSERNSLIMWFHTQTDVKLMRHGGAQPVTY